MMNLSKTMLRVARGEMVEQIPYAPRIDLWYLKNSLQGTLPASLSHLSPDELARSQGWGLHKIILEYQRYGQDAIIDRCLGVYNLPQQGYYYRLPPQVRRDVELQGDTMEVSYHTPKGILRGSWQFNQETLSMGITIPWIKRHVIRNADDCSVAAYIFSQLEVHSCPSDFADWFGPFEEDALEVAYALTAGSPMHHILKVLCSPEIFYLIMNDDFPALQELAESVGLFYERALEAASQCKAPVVLVGANFDETITYPEFFKNHILPWLNRASDYLHGQGKLMLCHTDGENRGLIDYLANCGMDIAEALCPYPMTKEPLHVYYDHWRARGITIFGGIPSSILDPESFSEKEFEEYVASLFATLSPGDRFILGVADTTPPQAPIERLQRIGDMTRQLGKLPLNETGKGRPASRVRVPSKLRETTDSENSGSLGFYSEVQQLLLKGDEKGLTDLCLSLLGQGVKAHEILDHGLMGAMGIIGERFKNNTVFIPEVLLSARAMNSITENVLGPHLSATSVKAKGRIVLGTVKGDLHDIGKNLVATMLKGCGFEVIDLGIDVPGSGFVNAVIDHKPEIVGISALLTTTMPQMKQVIQLLKDAGLCHQTRIMVGGAPVTPEFAKNIGADAYCENAGEAVPTAIAFLKELTN